MSFASPIRPQTSSEEQRQAAIEVRSVVLWIAVIIAVPLLSGGVLLHYGSRNFFNPDSDYFGTVFLFGVALTAGSLFLLYAVAIFGGAEIAAVPLRAKYPERPWMWRSDWAQGTITDGSRATLSTVCSVAILACALILFFATEARDISVYYLDLFPMLTWSVFGLGLAFTALMLTDATFRFVQYRKFGSSVLVLSTVPCAAGGPLSGTIQTSLREPPADGVMLSLDCVVTTYSRQRGSPERKNVWHREQTLQQAQLGIGAAGFIIPVEFEIPRNASSSGKLNSITECNWKLKATASLPGVDFESEFELPVFRLNSDGVIDRQVPDPA